jgi:N-acyl-D-aspartate/D-glutamate deacylase
MRTILFGALTLLALALPAGEPALAQSYDLILRGGRVLDGTGNPWFAADVALRDGRIAAVGRLDGAQARRVVDIGGLYIAPGFIDGHSHAGSGLTEPGLNAAQPLLAQGITTVFVNPDGGGSVDMAAQRAQLLARGLGVNVAQLVPHGSVRRAVLGMADRAPTDAELNRMRALVRAGMEAGAFGLSSGPYYTPGSYAKTEELVELARVVAPYDGIYTSHIRDEGDFSIGVVAAVDEVIRISREARIPGIVTHITVLGPRVWGFSSALCTGSSARAPRASRSSPTSIRTRRPPPASPAPWCRRGRRWAATAPCCAASTIPPSAIACVPASPRTSTGAVAPTASSSGIIAPIRRSRGAR